MFVQVMHRCGNIYCRQFMPVRSEHIVALKHILSPTAIYDDIDTFFQANGATIYALNFEASCRRRQNMPSTL